MPQEIERRFRIDLDLFQKVEGTLPAGRLFEQGYISLDPVVRIRIETHGPLPSDKIAELTIKGPGLIERSEFPFPVVISAAKQLMSLCRHRLTKIRYDLQYGEIHWEVDEFLGQHKGLWIAEVELQHVTQQFDQPTWLRNEVTQDHRFQNVFLAQHEGHFWEFDPV